MQSFALSRTTLGIIAAGIALIFGVLFYYGFVILSNDELSQETPSGEPKVIGSVTHIDQIIDLYDGFQAGMAELGYVEGRDVVYLFDPDQMVGRGGINQNPFALDPYIRHYIEEGADLIYAMSDEALEASVRVSEEMGAEIPIIFANISDPVEAGFIASIESSGNLLTGVLGGAVLAPEVEARKIAFLRQINPDFQRLGLFTDGFMAVPGPSVGILPVIREQAALEDIEIVEYTTDLPPTASDEELTAELDRIIAEIQPGDVDAMYHLPGHYIEFSEDNESQATVDLGIPYVLASLADEYRLRELGLGGTFAYYIDRFYIGDQAARIADKIFQGTHPSQIPVEFPEKTTLYINLDVAEKQGIEIPDSMLLIADEIYQSAE